MLWRQLRLTALLQNTGRLYNFQTGSELQNTSSSSKAPGKMKCFPISEIKWRFSLLSSPECTHVRGYTLNTKLFASADQIDCHL